MTLFDELKQNYLYSNSAVKRIIAINVLLFLVFAMMNVLGFLFASSLNSGIVTKYFTLPATFERFLYKPWAILSYMFLHDGFLHLLFNMLWLYWLGSILHEYLGNKRVYQAYFIGGVFGGLIYMLAYQFLPAFVHVRDTAYALGASAGVLSVVVAAATLLPNYEVQLLLFGNVRLKWIALVSVLLDVISIPNGNAGGHIAHIGGALFGFLFIKYLYNHTGFEKVFDRIAGLFKPKQKVKIHHRSVNIKTKNPNKPSQHEIDIILDKISKSGYESLSKKEKEMLFKASKD
ncbi:MAG: rhomboid family intramembrane serine protease [Bacteroidota bacterium]